jgi:hypothetical protein
MKFQCEMNHAKQERQILIRFISFIKFFFLFVICILAQISLFLHLKLKRAYFFKTKIDNGQQLIKFEK